MLSTTAGKKENEAKGQALRGATSFSAGLSSLAVSHDWLCCAQLFVTSFRTANHVRSRENSIRTEKFRRPCGIRGQSASLLSGCRESGIVASLPTCPLILRRHSSLSQVTAIGVRALNVRKELSLSCRCRAKGRAKEVRGSGALTRLSVPNPAKPNGVPSVFPAAFTRAN